MPEPLKLENVPGLGTVVAGPELDARVAREVLGWRVVRHDGPAGRYDRWEDADGVPSGFIPEAGYFGVFNPSAHDGFDAVCELSRKLGLMGTGIRVDVPTSGNEQATVRLYPVGGDHAREVKVRGPASLEYLGVMLCAAALLAVGGKGPVSCGSESSTPSPENAPSSPSSTS